MVKKKRKRKKRERDRDGIVKSIIMKFLFLKNRDKLPIVNIFSSILSAETFDFNVLFFYTKFLPYFKRIKK